MPAKLIFGFCQFYSVCVILIAATFNVSSLLQVAIITNMRFIQVLVEMKDTLQNFRFIENMTDDKIMILAKTGIFCHCAINVYEWAMVSDFIIVFQSFFYFLDRLSLAIFHP